MKEKVKELISKKFNVVDLNYNTNLSDLCEDSFGRVELLFSIEEMIGKKIKEDEVLEIETIKDLMDLVDKMNAG